LPERWRAPAFPLGGHELMALGASKGPDLGLVLKRLEQEWIESGFNLDREQLLAKAWTLIAELA
jgi:poly(A) polymerase